jgi:CheY-like chemotaxis protein
VERLAMSHEKGCPLEGRRILVVEDEYIVALDLEHTLRSLGCEVLGPVASVARALVLLANERPDAVTLDLNLLDGSAVPVAERLAGTGVPFVVISAYDPTSVDHPVLKQAPRLGKPFGAIVLRKSLERLLSTDGWEATGHQGATA